MKIGDDPNEFWQSALDRFPNRTALVSVDGQLITYAQLGRAVSNIADILVDYGAEPNAKIACAIPNFAVTVASWFATWRIGGHVMTAADPRQFEKFGLAPDFVIVPDGALSPVGTSVPMHASILIDEPGDQVEAPAGKTYFHTANTPRDSRAMAVSPIQLVQDACLYNDLLGAPVGGVYMTTGLSSLRAMRDVFRAFDAGVHVVGGDVAPEDVWPVIKKTNVTELMLSPLSLHRILGQDQKDDQTHAIDRVFIGAGTAQPELLMRAYDFFGDVIDLAAGTNETSVYAHKRFDPLTHRPGEIGTACCGIVGEVRDSDGIPVEFGQVGQLALWVPPLQRFEGYIDEAGAYDADGWVYPGFLAKMSADGQFTKLGRTDDRINLGGTRMFSGKIEAELERLPTVIRAAAIRVYSEDGAEALGIAIQPAADFDPKKLVTSLRRALRGIGEIYVKTMTSIPTDNAGHVDRNAVELAWPNLPAAT